MNWKILVLLAFSGWLIASPGQAQDENLEVTFGTIVRISANQIVIMEYDYETDMEKEEVYFLSAETRYENVESKAELKDGNSVEIIYFDKGGKKTAKTIKKEVYWEEEEGLGWEEEDPTPSLELDDFEPRG